MPYGMPGGDTPESDAWMEDCVSKVQAKGQDKVSAIKICKASYEKNHSARQRILKKV